VVGTESCIVPMSSSANFKCEKKARAANPCGLRIRDPEITIWINVEIVKAEERLLVEVVDERLGFQRCCVDLDYRRVLTW